MTGLRVGLVGTGFVAPFHFQAFSRVEGASIVGLCAHSNQAKAQALASAWGIRPYSCFDQMVDDPQIDALIIASMNTEHFAQVTRAVQAGKAVLVEKPVVTDQSHLAMLKELSQRTGVAIVPGHNFAYRRSVSAARSLMQNGQLGQVTYASFLSSHTISAEHETGWRRQKQWSSGGALMDSGHHLVYQSLALLGRPERVHAFSSNLVLKGMEGEDLAQVSLRYPSGMLACLVQSWTSDHGQALNGIRILGTEGQLVIDDCLWFNGRPLTDPEDYTQTFVAQAHRFVQVVRGEAEPASTLDDVGDALGIIEAAYTSAEQNQVLTLPV